MQESTYIPNERLSSYVKFIWCCENYTPESSKERVLPTGSSQLIINLNNQKFRHFRGDEFQEKVYDPAIITGIRSGHIFLDSYTRISTLGVVLKPGATSALFRIPSDEFLNQAASLDSVLKAGISELRDRLIAASTHKKKFSLMESFLSRLLNSEYQLHPAVDFAISQIDKKKGLLPISEILNQTGYSRRWFSQIFRNTVGIPPKQYARIQRFQYNLQLIRKTGTPNWPELAVSNGYFDQAHFIHDFKNLAGISPSEYALNQGDAANHLAV